MAKKIVVQHLMQVAVVQIWVWKNQGIYELMMLLHETYQILTRLAQFSHFYPISIWVKRIFGRIGVNPKTRVYATMMSVGINKELSPL